MPVTQDIAASYRGPRRVVRRLLGHGEHEGRLLAILMGGCAVVFVSSWPRLARQAHLTGEELSPLLGGALTGWLLIMPLVLYALAFVTYLALRLFYRNASAYGARLALFWALLAASPLLLLWGLMAGFLGPGIELSLVGALWLAVFLWFWISGLMVAAKGEGDGPAS